MLSLAPAVWRFQTMMDFRQFDEPATADFQPNKTPAKPVPTFARHLSEAGCSSDTPVSATGNAGSSGQGSHHSTPPCSRRSFEFPSSQERSTCSFADAQVQEEEQATVSRLFAAGVFDEPLKVNRSDSRSGHASEHHPQPEASAFSPPEQFPAGSLLERKEVRSFLNTEENRQQGVYLGDARKLKKQKVELECSDDISRANTKCDPTLLQEVLKQECCSKHGVLGATFSLNELIEMRHFVWQEKNNITRQDWGVQQWRHKAVLGSWTVHGRKVCSNGFKMMTRCSQGLVYDKWQAKFKAGELKPSNARISFLPPAALDVRTELYTAFAEYVDHILLRYSEKMPCHNKIFLPHNKILLDQANKYSQMPFSNPFHPQPPKALILQDKACFFNFFFKLCFPY